MFYIIVEDTLDDASRFRINHKLVLFLRIFHVAIGLAPALMSTSLSVRLLDLSDFSRNFFGIEFIDNIVKSREIIAFLICVDTVIDRDKSHAVFYKILIDVVPCHRIISAKSTEILRNNTVDHTIVYVSDHTFEVRAVEVGSGESELIPKSCTL